MTSFVGVFHLMTTFLSNHCGKNINGAAARTRICRVRNADIIQHTHTHSSQLGQSTYPTLHFVTESKSTQELNSNTNKNPPRTQRARGLMTSVQHQDMNVQMAISTHQYIEPILPVISRPRFICLPPLVSLTFWVVKRRLITGNVVSVDAKLSQFVVQ